nr:MDR family MFS transporter [Cellulomonas sp. PhB143]
MPRQDVVVVALLLLSAFVVILNETTMGVALPPIMDELGITPAVGQWLTTAFMLTMAVVIPATGWVIQRLGTRRAYVLAMALFSAGTLVAAMSPGFPMLLAGRVVQASGTAIMLPLLMTTIMTVVPPRSRGRVMGNVAIVMSAAPALGPTLSGAVLEVSGWRTIFLVVLPIALVSLVLGAVFVRDTAERSSTRLDPWSLLLAAAAFGGLVYGLSSLGEAAQATTVVPVWVPLAGGATALALFVWRQLALQRGDEALLDLRVFAARDFTVALAIMAVSMVALFGSIILLPLYLQDVLGMTPLATGLLVLPGGLLMGLLGPTVGSLYDRVGPRPLVVPGTVAVTASLAMLAMVDAQTSTWYVLGAHVVLSLGLAFVFTPLFTAALSALSPHLYSHGSAAISTVQQLAGAAGTALFVAVLTTTSLALGEDGASPTTALAGGVARAFAWGAAVLVVAVVAAFWLRRPAPEEQDLTPEPAAAPDEHEPTSADDPDSVENTDYGLPSGERATR